MIDTILHFIASFDLISPILAVIQNAANGPSHTFLIPEDCGWSGRRIEHLLRSHGVKTWGLMIINRMLRITVRQAQARWAQYLLDREGIPIQYGVLDESTGRTFRSAQKDDQAGPLETVTHWLDELAGLLDR
jgi:hypothetical protein